MSFFAVVKTFPSSSRTLAVIVTIDLPWQDVSIALNNRFVNNYVPSTERSRPWSKYQVSGLRITKDFELSNQNQGRVFLGLENIGDRAYMVKKNYPMPPRTLTGGLEFKF